VGKDGSELVEDFKSYADHPAMLDFECADAVGYGSVALGPSRSIPDEFRELAEKDL
jgi:hypothetical protein